jgi:hypothetical protein
MDCGDELEYCSLVLGFLHGVRGEFTHSGILNFVGKFTSHTVQKPQPQKTIFIPRRKSKIKINLSSL